MSRLTGWLYSLRALLRRDAADRDTADEIAFHVDRQARKHESHGLSSDDARRRALQEFGGTTRWREEVREARAGAAIDVIEQDLRYAARGLVRRPGFTAVAVLTLAIGIGGTTAIFSAVNTLLLRRLPYAAPEQLMMVSLTSPASGGLRARDDMVWSYPKYAVFRDAQSVFTDMSLYTTPQRLTATSGAVELLQGEFVGARYLRTLGLAPVRGRDFDPGIDAHAGADRQVIISHSLWQRRYNADPSTIGKALDLDGNPYTIVGVAPVGFRGSPARETCSFRSPLAPREIWKSRIRITSSSSWRGAGPTSALRPRPPRSTCSARVYATRFLIPRCTVASGVPLPAPSATLACSRSFVDRSWLHLAP
jgi:putative ABC transport system permease protein